MLRFEVRQIPGLVSADNGKMPVSVQLTRADFTVKEIERQVNSRCRAVPDYL